MIAIGDVVEGRMREVFLGAWDISHDVLGLSQGFAGEARGDKTFERRHDGWSLRCGVWCESIGRGCVIGSMKNCCKLICFSAMKKSVDLRDK